MNDSDYSSDDIDERVRAVAQYLADMPDSNRTRIELILDRTARSPVSEGTATDLFRSLRDAIEQARGGEADSLSAVVLLKLLDTDLPAPLEAFDSDARELLEKWRTLYGPDIARVHSIGIHGEHDWKQAYVRAVQYQSGDVIDRRVQYHIRRMDGEVLRLEMPADSSLRLARNLLRGLADLPDELFADLEGDVASDVLDLARSVDERMERSDTPEA